MGTGNRFNEQEDVNPDDTVCVVCGAKLPEDPAEVDPAFDGFCSDECVEKYEGEPATLCDPLTHTVYVRWEGDEEETPVLVTASEYEVLSELVNEEVL